MFLPIIHKYPLDLESVRHIVGEQTNYRSLEHNRNPSKRKEVQIANTLLDMQ